MVCRAALLLVIVATSPACLVATLHPLYGHETIAWDPALVGTWQSEDDATLLRVARDEWRSYRIEYEHPIETGALTGYLTAIGDLYYMDVMPVRGAEHGAFVLPVHAAVRIRRVDDERLELTPLAYDAFLDAARGRTGVGGLAFVLDQKQNAVVSSPTSELRRWIGRQGASSRLMGPTTTFRRVKAGS